VDDRGREDESVRRRMEERQQSNEVSQWASVRPVDLLECITRTCITYLPRAPRVLPPGFTGAGGGGSTW